MFVSCRGLKDKTLGIIVLSDAIEPVFKSGMQVPICLMKNVFDTCS